MWVATRNVETAAGTVTVGRLVPDGDPILDGAEPGAFVRVDQPAGAVVEDAAADRPRRSRRVVL